ncbi:MAG: hypothetical protein Q7T18_10820 [Sedimentisphaerales bacterium]|nr:hypothetical protein [Sedimentisphaerales bacterium]
MNASYSRLVMEARRTVNQVMGGMRGMPAPLNDKRMFGNEIRLEYALGRIFILNFRGVANREYEDGLELVCSKFTALLMPEHSPKGGWATWLVSKGIVAPTASASGFMVLGEERISKLL